VAAIVEQAAGRSLTEEGRALAGAVYEETEGNPFFVREVLRHLAETGAVERQEGGWTTRLPVDQLGIPEGVRDVVGRRLARLSSDTNHALRIAAVVGPEFELGVVQAAGDVSEETLLGAVEEAAAARLVTEVSSTRFRFAHALVRATLYESLSAARKVTLHRKAAEAIETIHRAALDDYVPALAHHWAKASAAVTDASRAVDYARQAGDRALAQLAHDEAANYYASGLDLLDAGGADPTDPRRVELLIGRGEAQRRAGDPGYRQTLLDAAGLAARLGDAPALVRAALANTMGNVWTGILVVDTDRVQMLEAAIAAVGGDDLRRRVRLLATLGLELSWEDDHRRRLALSEEALRIARSLDDPETLAHVLLARDYTITAPENLTERFTATSELLAIAEQLGDPVLASRALGLRFKAAMELADVAEAERCLARNQALVTDLGQPILSWATFHHHATLRVLRSEADAEAAILAAYEFGVSAGRPEIGLLSASQRFPLYLEQGRLGEIVEILRQTIERLRQADPDRALYPLAQARWAFVLAETGQMEAAARHFDDLAATGFAHPTNNVAWLLFAVQCAWLCARLRREECVPPLRSRLEPYADQLVVASFGGEVSGSVALYLGLLATTVGDWQQAETYFTAAVATHDRIGAPAWLGRSHLEWARMLLARGEPGDGDRARDLLRQALATARELGLANIERDAVELLGSQ
jgi:tetratricopeptide (TPR) repeat protein